jgi:hypothetical protein
MKLRLPQSPLYAKKLQGSPAQIARRKGSKNLERRREGRRRKRSAKHRSTEMLPVPLILHTSSQNLVPHRHLPSLLYLDHKRGNDRWVNMLLSSTMTNLDTNRRRIFNNMPLRDTRKSRLVEHMPVQRVDTK